MVNGDVHCPDCGFPQGRPEEERAAFLRTQRAGSDAAVDRVKLVVNARNWLWAVAGFNMLPYLLTRDKALILAGLMISLIFSGLALWTRREPYPAILTALVLYVSLQLLLVVEDPMNIMRGLIFKFIIIGILIKALRSVHGPVMA
jgi:hypothetical protein